MTFKITETNLTRRGLLARAGAIGIGATALAALATKPAEASNTTVVDVLNFALNLEYLEAEFYTYATAGHSISGVSTPYGVIKSNTNAVSAGGTTAADMTAVTFPDSASQTIAQQITLDEQAHVALLQSVLGRYAVAEPNINLSAIDSLLPSGATSYQRFLAIARAFEDTGVSAYGGAATLVRSSAEYLQAAADILVAEAYHASQVRLLVAQNNLALFKIDPLDIVPPPAGTQYFDLGKAIAVTRTPSQVLGIVYGASTSTAYAPAGTSKGGFYPNGVNGKVHVV